MKEHATWIWQDGDFVAFNQANIHVLNHSLHYGVGVFEGVRAYHHNGQSIIFRLHDHSIRLLDSAKILNMTTRYSADEVDAIQMALIKRNALTDAYIRPLIYYDGDGYIGLHQKHLSTKLVIVALPWKNYLSDEQYQRGIHVRTSSFVRYHPNSMLAKAKSTAKYISTIMALQEASAANVDDGIFLDQQGYVSEGTGCNIFMVKNNVIYTPETSSALKGITRDTVLTLANEHHYQAIEKTFTRDELYIADEVFFTGTAAQIVAITQVDGRKISDACPGPVTKWLMEKYHQCVNGNDEEHTDWLSYIEH